MNFALTFGTQATPGGRKCIQGNISVVPGLGSDPNCSLSAAAWFRTQNPNPTTI